MADTAPSGRRAAGGVFPSALCFCQAFRAVLRPGCGRIVAVRQFLTSGERQKTSNKMDLIS
jgi:hypothetical protein